MKKFLGFLVAVFTLLFLNISYASWVYDFKFDATGNFELKEVGGKIDNYLGSSTTPYASFTTLEGAVNNAKSYTDSGQTVNMYLTTGSFINVTNQKVTLTSGMNLYMPYDGKTCDISSDDEVSSLSKTFIDINDNNIKNNNVSGLYFYNSTLTINSGASVTIGGKFQECGVSGLYSQISLDNRSSITVSGTLTCKGYVKEIDSNNIDQEGNINYLSQDQIYNSNDSSRYINVLSGGTIFIPMAFYDAGGSMGSLTGLNDAGVFPINTFDFPNVQTYFRINAGATFNSIGRLARSSGNLTVPINQSITVVKPSTSSASSLLTLSSGFVAFEYCPLTPGYTKKDASRTYLAVNGEVSLGYLAMTVQGQTISTANVFLPFSYKFRIYIGNNGTFNTNQYSIKFLPGSMLKILDGGVFNLSSDFIAYKSNSLDGLSTSYPNTYDDAEIVINGTFKANSGSTVGAHFKTLCSSNSASLDFSNVSQNSLNASSPEGMSGTMVTIYSSGDFYDETASTTSSLLVKAGLIINSRGGDLYCWNSDGSLSSYVLSVVINNSKNYDYPLAGYQVYKYDANGNETLLTTEGAYESTSKDFILAAGESYKIISLDRAEGTEITKQSGTNYTFTSGETYLIQSDTEVTIYPGEGILIRCSISNGSGSGGASHKIYEKTNGDYYQIASFDGPISYIDVAVKKGATIKYYIELGPRNTLTHELGKHYLIDGIVDKTKVFTVDEMSGATELKTTTTGDDFITGAAGGTTSYSEVSNIQSSCTIHQLLVKPEESGGGCFAKGTEILMADGSYKKIEDIKVGDYIRTFSHETGQFENQFITYIPYHSEDIYEVLKLNFEGGYSIEVLYAHGFMNASSRLYEEISPDNVIDKVGQEYMFVENNRLVGRHLVSYEIYNKVTECYSLSSAYNLNHIANGALCISDDIEGLYNYFELDESFKYDEEKKSQDIEKYGLLSYDEVSYFMSREIYELFNVKYLSVSIGKGMITIEKMEEYIEKFA